MLRNSSILHTAIGLAIVALISQPLAGCSGASQALPAGNLTGPTATSQLSSAIAGRVRPDDVDPYFVTWTGNCTVYEVYEGVPPNGVWRFEYIPYGCDPAEGTNTGGTYEKATKNWLVGQSTSAIAIYNPKWKEVGTLTNGLTGAQVGIATDLKGDIFASNFPSNTLTEYARGGTSPIASYTDTNLASLSYVTVDKNDNVYVSGQSEGSGGLEVDELSTGSSQFSPIKTITGITGAGIVVAHSGKALWVCDEGNGSKGTISAYAIPSFKRSVQFAYSGSDTGIAVAASGKQVYAVDNVAYGSEYSVSLVIYDAKTGKVINASPGITTAKPAMGISQKP